MRAVDLTGIRSGEFVNHLTLYGESVSPRELERRESLVGALLLSKE